MAVARLNHRGVMETLFFVCLTMLLESGHTRFGGKMLLYRFLSVKMLRTATGTDKPYKTQTKYIMQQTEYMFN